MENQNLIEFYLLMKNYVDSYGTSGMEREERRQYNKGKKLHLEAEVVKAKGEKLLQELIG